MPIYGYKCKKCGVDKDVIKPMAESDSEEICDCGEVMIRDFGGFRCCNDSYAVPIVSDSLAVPVHQIAEHRRKFPDIEVTSKGQPVFNNYKKHQAYLDKTGFIKVPKRRTLI